jgi:hypothetical protein
MAGPWEAVPEVRERLPSMQKTSMVGPLGGSPEGPWAPTINEKKYRRLILWEAVLRSGSAHHQRKKMSPMTPLKAVPEAWERPPPTQKISTAAPLEAVLGVWEHPPLNSKTSMVGPQAPLCNTPCYEKVNKTLNMQLSQKVRANQVVKVWNLNLRLGLKFKVLSSV